MTAVLSPDDREWLRRSRVSSGVPERVTDSRTIAQIAALVLSGDAVRTRSAKSARKSA